MGAVTLMLTVLGERQYTIAENAIMGPLLLHDAGMGTGSGPFSRYLSGRSQKMERRLVFVWLALLQHCPLA